MPRKIRQLKADLRQVGAYQVSQEGSHTSGNILLLQRLVLFYLAMMETMPNRIKKKLYANSYDK